MSDPTHGGRTPEAIARAVLRERQVLELRAAGVSINEIAAQLGVSPSRCSHIYKRALQRVPSPNFETMRQEHNLRYERLIRALWPQALGRPATGSEPAVPPDPSAVREIRQLIHGHRRMNGLDAPLRISATLEVVTVDALDAEIQRLEAELARGDHERNSDTAGASERTVDSGTAVVGAEGETSG